MCLEGVMALILLQFNLAWDIVPVFNHAPFPLSNLPTQFLWSRWINKFLGMLHSFHM